MTEQEDDQFYVERVQKDRDRDSFAELYSRHFNTVYRLIAKIVLEEGVAEELTQDTFMKASQHIGTFRNHSSFKTWVCRIGVNLANGHVRRVITARGHAETLRTDAESSTSPTSPRDSLFWKEETMRVSQAMERLAPELRTSLVLTVIEGLEPVEAARIQGCSRATLYWRVHQARKQLKAEMGDD